MNRTEHNSEALLDAAINEVTTEAVAPQVVEEARIRAWARIKAQAAAEQAASPAARPPEHIRSCADFQALLPDFRDGKLSLARRMLIEDHIHECVACRRAMHPEANMKPIAKVVELPRRTWTPKRWAIAAMLVIGVGSATWVGYDRLGPAPAGSRATLVAANGGVFRLSQGILQPVASGATFNEGDRVRTSNGAHAMVRLMDGSVVELAERGEFGVSADRLNTTVNLGRGRIIVQAAKRSRGHLYVGTGDARVAVTGTVFSVNRGVAGARVSVVEGEVIVENRGNDDVLRAGDQQTTHPSIARVPVPEEIAWSQNYDQHLALLKQFVDLKEKLENVQMPGLRYSSRLLDAVPADTSIYINVPNLSRAVADVQRIVSDQARQSPEMRQFLSDGLPQFELFTQKLAALGEYLGDEITFAFQGCSGFCGVAIAEVHRPGLKEFIQKEAAGVGAPFRIIEGSSIPSTQKGELLVAFAGNRVIVGEQGQFVSAAARGASGFAETAFGQAIGETFKRGTGVVVGVDLEHMIARELSSHDAAGQSIMSGIDKVKYLIAEQRGSNDKSEYLASLRFNSARTGLASWIAEPSAMGSLQFVSPQAQFASSIAMKNPVQLLDEALTMAGGNVRPFEQFQREAGIDFRQEVASALGGEVTFAFDGPMLPTPSWKVVAEVNNPVKLQTALEKMIQVVNRELQKNGKTQVELQSSRGTLRSDQNLIEHVLKIGLPLVPEIHYAYVDGYLVMTPSQGLLMKSIGDRQAGVTLPRSRQFTRMLPRDQRTSFSAMFYQNAGELLGLMAKGGGTAAGTTPEQQQQVDEIARRVEPMLVCFYGSTDRLEVASQGSAWNLLMNSFAGNLLAVKSHGTRPVLKAYR